MDGKYRDDPNVDEAVEKRPLNPITVEVETYPTALYRDWETDRKSTRLNSSHRL